MSDTQPDPDYLSEFLKYVQNGVNVSADEGDSVKRLTRHLQEDLAKDEDKVANLGVLRSVVLTSRSGGNNTSSAEIVYGSADNMPSADAFVNYVTALASEPLALRAVHTMIVGHYEGKSLQRTKAELALALQAGEAEVEKAMLPFVDNNTVRWSKNARSEEYYVLNEHSMIMLLSLAG